MPEPTMCNHEGYPRYASGARWRTFCELASGHSGPHMALGVQDSVVRGWGHNDA